MTGLFNGRGPLWKKGDLDALIGVFIDGFAKVITAAAVLQFSIGVPVEIVYGKIIPAIGLTILILNGFFTLYSRHLNKKEGRDDYVALPTGLHATRVFTWLFAIMTPVYLATGDGILAWKVGVMANFISSIIFIATGFLSNWIQKTIPAAALFGTLAGGAVAFLGVNVISKMFNQPLIAIVAVLVLLVLYLGKIEGKVPAPLISILLGTAVSWFIGFNNAETFNRGISNSYFALPGFSVDFLSIPFEVLMPYIGIILIFTIHGAINSLMGISQAQEAGDNIDSKKSILVIGIVNILSCFIGNPFPLGVFWGHNSWKELKAGTSYSFGVGAIYLVLCFSGLIAIINGIVPEQATLPILLFIALTSVGQAFNKVESKYYPIIGLTIILSLMEVLFDKTETAIKAVLGLVGIKPFEVLGTPDIHANLTAQKMDAIGYLTMGKGAMFIALVWGSMLVFVMQRQWKKACVAALFGAVFTYTGMIHYLQPTLGVNIELAVIYVLVGLSFLLLGLRFKKETAV